jgi:hypothetical protein
LVALAQRLGIPADDAVQLVVRYLDHSVGEPSTTPLGGGVEIVKRRWRRPGPRRRRRTGDRRLCTEPQAEIERGSEV